MELELIDWAFIVGYCVLAFGIGMGLAKRAGSSMTEFFLAGRSLPWWIAGTSIVATTFAADTPLVISGWIRSKGIYENWVWWNLVMSGMLCTFFYAHLWRRSGVITDVELTEMRYKGRSAAILRVFMVIYLGILYNCIIIGWVLLAMTKICEVTLGWDKMLSMSVLIVIAVAYTVLSGFWGVVMTDLIQFVMAMTGSIALACIVVYQLGGPVDMVQQISASENFRPEVFHLVPDLKTAGMLALITFAIQLSFQWMPKGQGDGYTAQRLLSTKNEKHAVLASLWYNFANFVLRPWPWIIVGLGSFVFFTDAQLPLTPKGEPDYEMAYPMMMVKFLPHGLLGLMVASLLAAFMSTIDTHLNWGASYLVNDVYKRFIKPDASAKHYVLVSRLTIVLLMAFAALVTWNLDTIEGAWKYIIVLGSGSGLVLLLRWYWWRINAWSEISALACAFVIANGFLLIKILPDNQLRDNLIWLYDSDQYAILLVGIVLICAAVWLAVTFLTKPEEEEHLKAFYKKVKPSGWWGPIAAQCPEIQSEPARNGWLGWVLGVVCIYSGLFGIGYLCLGRYPGGVAFLVVMAITGWLTIKQVNPEVTTGE